MTKRVYTEEEKERKISHFQRVIRYRKLFGWVFSGVGLVLFFVGLKNAQNPLIMVNGALFFGYGLFMVRQAKKPVPSLADQNKFSDFHLAQKFIPTMPEGGAFLGHVLHFLNNTLPSSDRGASSPGYP